MKKIIVCAVALFAVVGCGGGGGEDTSNTPSPSETSPASAEFNPIEYEGFYNIVSHDCPPAFDKTFVDTEISYLYSATVDGYKFYYYISSGGKYIWTNSDGSELAFCIQGFENGQCKYNQACIGNNLRDKDIWELTCDDTYGGFCQATYERS